MDKFEWADASAKLGVWLPEVLEKVAPDGNPDNDWGISWTTGNNGIMIHGSIKELEFMVARMVIALDDLRMEASRG
jgi:hypothetical protein